VEAVVTADAPAAEAGTPVDEGAPVGPSESEEGSFLAEQRSAAIPESQPAVRRTAPDEESGPPLPALDKLVERIPAATRDVMEELFRARFVTVKRIPKSALK
jgi:hypothetical protein